jgi:hypothetical protein
VRRKRPKKPSIARRLGWEAEQERVAARLGWEVWRAAILVSLPALVNCPPRISDLSE